MRKMLLIASAIFFLAGLAADAWAQPNSSGTAGATLAAGIAPLTISAEDLSANAAGTIAITAMPVSETRFSIGGTGLNAYLTDFNGDGTDDALYVPLYQKELSALPGLYNVRITENVAAPAVAIDSNGNGKIDGLLFAPLYNNASVNAALDPASECKKIPDCFWTGSICKCLK